MKRPADLHVHLPAHLQDVCEILAKGILRLRTRSEMIASRLASENGEFPLHFQPHQRGHATRTNRRDA